MQIESGWIESKLKSKVKVKVKSTFNVQQKNFCLKKQRDFHPTKSQNHLNNFNYCWMQIESGWIESKLKSKVKVKVKRTFNVSKNIFEEGLKSRCFFKQKEMKLLSLNSIFNSAKSAIN